MSHDDFSMYGRRNLRSPLPPTENEIDSKSIKEGEYITVARWLNVYDCSYVGDVMRVELVDYPRLILRKVSKYEHERENTIKITATDVAFHRPGQSYIDFHIIEQADGIADMAEVKDFIKSSKEKKKLKINSKVSLGSVDSPSFSYMYTTPDSEQLKTEKGEKAVTFTIDPYFLKD